MKRVFLFLLCVLVVCCGCSEQTGTTNIDVKDKGEVVVDSKDTATTDVILPKKEEKTYSSYKDAYREIVKETLDDENGSGILRYGTLIDLEKDNVPELLLVTPGKEVYAELSVYKFENDRCTKIYEKSLGARMGQTDVSYSFGMNETISPSCLVTFQSESEWTTECMHVFYLDDGEPKENVLLGCSDVALDSASFNWEDPFNYFEIDGKEVEKNSFYDRYNKICDGFIEVDVVCDIELGYEGNYDPRNKMVYFTEEARNEFLSMLDL